MNQVSSKVITGAFSCALALLSGVVITSYLSVRQSNQDKQWVIHSYNVMATIKDMNIGLLSAESKRRGFVLVGKASYIKIYQQDQDKVYKSLNKLYNLTKDNSKQQRRLNEIKPLIDKRFIFFDKSIKLFSQNSKDLSSQITITEENSRLNEPIETISKEMEGEEKILLKLRTQQTSRSISRTNILVGLGYGFGLVLLISVYLLLRKQIFVNTVLSQEAISLEKKAAKSQLASFLESTTDAFVALDNNWNYTYVNQRASKIFNRTPEELIGKHIWTEFPEGIGQKFYHTYYQAIAEQRMMQIEEYYPPWNCWYENRIYPTQDGLCIFFQDTTQRKQLEIALQYQIEFDQLVARISTRFINLSCSEIPNSINLALQEISDFSKVDTSFIIKFSDDKTFINMIYEWVTPGLTPHIENIQNFPYNSFSWANARAMQGEVVYFTSLLELPEEAAIDREIWHENNIKSLISIPLNYQGSCFGVLGFATFDQEKAWSENSVRLLKIVGEIFTNALQRQQAELELQQQEQRWQLAIKGNKDGIWDHDLISGRHFLSPRCREMLGYEDNEITTFSEWLNLIYLTDQEILKTAFEAHLTRQTPYYSSEYRMRCKDGSYKWLLARGQALWNEAGIPIRAVGSITDITERKQAEAAIFQLNQELETRVQQRTAALQISEAELQKLNQELLRSNQDLEQFAYIASHDLQEPLRAIIGFTQILEAKYQEHLDESAQRYIKIIIDAGKRMHQLVHDLLKYSRVSIRDEEFTVIDSNQVLNQAMINLQVSITESQANITHDALPRVLADRTQLVQVFQNIIANAIKFCRQQPQIHIGVKEIESSLYTHKYLFWIQDNGIGIKPQYIECIFEIFRRLHTRNEFSGTGIGLAICKKIVERHNGNIWAESEPEVGTTFYFTLTAPSESLLVNRAP